MSSETTTLIEPITTQTTTSTRLLEVDALRASAILLVILYHSFRVFDISHINLQDSGFTYNFKWVLDHIISYFRMPLLIFVSGYMFAFLKITKGKYRDTTNLIKVKAKRLLLPYITFAPITFICYNLWKEGTGEYALVPVGHLWFIVMLFWCFSITQYLSTRINLASPKILIPLILVLSLCYPLSFIIKDYLGIASCIRWLWCFILGYGACSYPNSHKLKHLSAFQLLSLTILCLILIIGINYLNSYNSKIAILCHAPIMGLSVLTIWGMVFSMQIKHLPSYFVKIIKCSYGMYVVHMWILSLIIIKIDTIMDIIPTHHILVGILIFLVVCLSSFIFSSVLLKTKIGRYLIG